MDACHVKAKYIYTYVGLTTMIWEIQQMNSKSNVCICICKIWIQIQIQMQMHHRHHQLRQDFVGLNLSLVIIILLHLSNLWLFDGSLMPLMQWISCLPSKQKCLPDICKAKLDIYVTSFVFSMLEHWTLNVQCSMFNLPILDVWHAW